MAGQTRLHGGLDTELCPGTKTTIRRRFLSGPRFTRRALEGTLSGWGRRSLMLEGTGLRCVHLTVGLAGQWTWRLLQSTDHGLLSLGRVGQIHHPCWGTAVCAAADHLPVHPHLLP